MQATDNLMRHRDVAMILATGGSAMVRAAYSSGTPAIGVGPGNGPAYLEKTCDLPLAVKRIMDSKTFDNGTATINTEICEQLGIDFDELSETFAPYCTKVQSIVTAESFDEVQ